MAAPNGFGAIHHVTPSSLQRLWVPSVENLRTAPRATTAIAASFEAAGTGAQASRRRVRLRTYIVQSAPGYALFLYGPRHRSHGIHRRPPDRAARGGGTRRARARPRPRSAGRRARDRG